MKQNTSLINSKGFTLIELLVVLTIVMLITSMVAPIGINLVEKAKAQTQYITLQTYFKNISQLAFLSSTPITVVVEETSLIMSSEVHLQSEKKFSNLIFTDYPQRIVFSKSGLPSISELSLLVHDKHRTLDLTKLFINE